MQEPGEGVLDAAIQKLDRAVALLETRVVGAVRDAQAHAGGAFDQDRANLASELDAARARERELQEAGGEAARALGRAIAEIRAALGEERAAALTDKEQI